MLPKKAVAWCMVTSVLVLCSISIFGLMSTMAEAEQDTTIHTEISKSEKSKKSEAYEVKGPVTIKVILKRHYLDGEVSEEVVHETILSMQDFWAEYESWKLVAQSDGKMVFKKKVNDISPLLKANGYFGLSEDGTLTIYKGEPNSKEVIRSFFQIDLGKLESRRQKELEKGIPVISKDHYKKVIESFKMYSF